MFECHPGVCPVPEKCRNMRFQKRQYPNLECFRTIEGRGWGLKSNQVIRRGGFVIEYVGELITMEEYRGRMAANQLTGEENYYYLTIDAHRMIDAGPKGNLARFMNHSCDPNCIAQKWTVNGDIRVGLFAIKDIQPGAELTFNYQFETVGHTSLSLSSLSLSLSPRWAIARSSACAGRPTAQDLSGRSPTKRRRR